MRPFSLLAMMMSRKKIKVRSKQSKDCDMRVAVDLPTCIKYKVTKRRESNGSGSLLHCDFVRNLGDSKVNGRNSNCCAMRF